jgi:hypothetical protein
MHESAARTQPKGSLRNFRNCPFPDPGPLTVKAEGPTVPLQSKRLCPPALLPSGLLYFPPRQKTFFFPPLDKEQESKYDEEEIGPSLWKKKMNE